MKKLALVLALTLVAFAGSSFAQVGWDDNNVGLYTDQAGTTNCVTVDSDIPFYTYLVFTNLISPDVASWEIQLTYDNVMLLAVQPYPVGQYILIEPRPGELMVGLATPQLAVGGNFVAARIRLMVENTAPASVTPDGVFFHLLDAKVPAYINGAGAEFALQSITAVHTPFMLINDGCVVGTETTSFGDVKSLFR
jgi:hypothetical protein